MYVKPSVGWQTLTLNDLLRILFYFVYLLIYLCMCAYVKKKDECYPDIIGWKRDNERTNATLTYLDGNEITQQMTKNILQDEELEDR